ncbi:aspartyl-tRNA synthetase cytoplasmic [Laetiporus sulphureus 93-53]|uniref:aspartate--tRNA ligase n=1 Tax=Laetiporus sulphureus 93-53 TaxID=1314785 RepID=A0A165DCY7_9APHY|nr:aspartyl-tRNA synthetase cytoplasmic [Laetiporus sulphureus 93-53]KZT04593.1 aspartyl-tRNA synthetase cytoplasmic [Laetiporus sulphureus 93-53]
MSSIKKVIHRARNSISSGHCSSPVRELDDDAHNRHASNGHAHVDDTNADCPTAAQRQQAHEPDKPHHTQRPSTEMRRRRMSFTEQKVERHMERKEIDKREAAERKERQKHAHDEDPLRDNYGDLPMNMSQNLSETRLSSLIAVNDMEQGTHVTFRARVHHIRPLGSKIVFIIFRSQLSTLQGVLAEEEYKVSQNMIHWAEGLNRETVVLVEGMVQNPPEDQSEVKSARVKSREVKVEKLYVVAGPTSPPPFQVEDVSRAEKVYHQEDAHFSRVNQKTRLLNRVLDLRSPTNQAIFRIRAGVGTLFREYLLERNFLEIQSSKFQKTSTESGAAVFKVDYFRRPAFLAQSPQLAKQMCIAGDMERVFEIGPVFRAENSNTHRHLTEFTGLDLEMQFESHYHEVLDTIDELLKYIIKGVQKRYREEIETVKLQFPHDDLVILDETPRLRFADGIRMLKESGWKEEDGSEPSEWADLSTKAEQRLGVLMKAKYGADYYILDKFPLEVRPFYTMPDPQDHRLSNSFDIFLRGEEILSGGQRIHVAPMLEERMRAVGIDPDSMKDYVDGFRWGCPPHGGGGIGLERVVMLFLKLGDIRYASLFPRDPRSFPANGQDLAEASMSAATHMILHGPEATTFKEGYPHGDMPLLQDLIAKYGDSTNTSWIDPAWTVWRDPATGAAVGYIPQNEFAVAFGNPLCEHKQMGRVVQAYVKYVEEKNLKPVWCCIDKECERIVAEDMGWSAIIAVAEERLNPIEVDPAANDKTVRRKIHKAERDGVKIVEVEGGMDPKTREKLEERCKEWAENRKGTQIHLTGVRPFDDMKHRKYFYAVDKDGKPCAMVVLAQLAPTHGFQIKWSLEFPGAPLGAIEYILTHVIKKLGDAGLRSATFGAGATERLQRVDNLGGFRVRTLEKTYNGIASTFHLSGKGDFRAKFGIHQEPMFICYPKGGLGMKGIEAIMAALQMPK